MSVQTLGPARSDWAADRPLDAWPDDPESAFPPDPAAEDDCARVWAECNSDLARHLASIPEPPDSPEQSVTALEFAEDALAGGPDAAATILAAVDPGPGSAAWVGMLDPARVTPASMVGVIAATERLASWVQALQHRWLASFTEPGVAATRDGLLAYASAPGHPLHRSPQPTSGSVGCADAGAGLDSGRAEAGGKDEAGPGFRPHGKIQESRLTLAIFWADGPW